MTGIFPVLILLMLTAVLSASQVVTTKIVWKGKVTVNEPVTVKPPGSIEIHPGTEVNFTGNGRIYYISYGFKAGNAIFRADKPLEKYPRIFIRSGLNDSVSFKNCRFINLICRKTPAAVRTIFPKIEMLNCRFENCSTVNFNHDMHSDIGKNVFINSEGSGLMMAGSKYSRIHDNNFIAGKKSLVLLNMRSSSEFCEIIGNRFSDAPRMALFIHGKVNGNRIKDNSFFSCAIGIYLGGQDLRNISIHGNMISNNKTGIYFLNGGNNNQISNCVIWKCTTGLYAAAKKGTLNVQNSVFDKCGAAVSVRGKAIIPKLQHNCFWQNKKNFSETIDAAKIPQNNLFTDPLFVNPDQDNFRLKEKSFGYLVDSPLLKSGTPKGINIGLFP